MGEKAVWDAFHLKECCDICKEEVQGGNRPLGFLNRVGWKNLEDKFFDKTKKKLTRTQFKNKWDNLKGEYTLFMESKHVATGLGWNYAARTIECSEEWWAKHLQNCKNCKHVRFRKQVPPYLDELEVMFDKAHVNGATASIPGELSSDSSEDEKVIAEKLDNDIAEIKVSSSKKSKAHKKRKMMTLERKAEKSPFFREYKSILANINTGVEKITASVQASSTTGSNHGSHVSSIANFMRMLKECGIQEKTALYYTGTKLAMKPEVREVFVMIETNEGKLDWLERAHEDEMMKRV